MKVILSGRARQDLFTIGHFIAADNPERARSFVLDLRAACLDLAEAPFRFAQLDGFEAQGYRRRVRQLSHYLPCHRGGCNCPACGVRGTRCWRNCRSSFVKRNAPGRIGDCGVLSFLRRRHCPARPGNPVYQTRVWTTRTSRVVTMDWSSRV